MINLMSRLFKTKDELPDSHVVHPVDTASSHTAQSSYKPDTITESSQHSHQPTLPCTVPYDQDQHLELLQQQIRSDQKGTKRAASIGNLADTLHALATLPEWLSKTHVIIKDGDSKKPVGIVMLTGFTPEVKESGIWLAESERGSGLAKQAGREAIRAAFESDPKLLQIRANSASSNKASIRLAENLGFKPDSTYAATWKAVPEQMIQRALIPLTTGEFARPFSMNRDDAKKLI